MSKRFVRSLALALAGISLSALQPVSAQVELAGSAVSRYVWRGLDVLEGRAAFQPSVSVSHGSGFALGLWTSFGLNGRGEALAPANATPVSELDEVDLTVSYTRAIGAVEVVAGLAHYNWFKSEDWRRQWPRGAATAAEAFLGATFASLPGSPSVTAYYDVNSESGARADGAAGYYVSGALAHALELGSLPALDLSASAGYMDQGWVEEAGISDVNVGLATSLSVGGVALAPSLNATYRPWAGERTALVWAGVQASWSPAGR